MNTSPIIDIKNASVFRRSTHVFKQFNLKVEAGEHIAILGPNGAGKSTLLKLLTRELYPVEREGSHLKLFGEQRINLWQLREKIGVVSNDFQNQYEALATGLDVVVSGFFGSVGMHQHQHPSPEQISQAEKKLEQFHITNLKDRQFLQLSTGQQRRLLLARAAVHNPRLMIFDEPSNSLDVQAAFQILKDMRQLSKAGTTILLATHHIHEILPEIKRVIILKDGEVRFDGDKKQALTSERLRDIFEAEIAVSEHNGFYQWMPAD